MHKYQVCLLWFFFFFFCFCFFFLVFCFGRVDLILADLIFQTIFLPSPGIKKDQQARIRKSIFFFFSEIGTSSVFLFLCYFFIYVEFLDMFCWYQEFMSSFKCDDLICSKFKFLVKLIYSCF